MRTAIQFTLTLMLLAMSGPTLGQDIVAQMVGLVPDQPHTYAQMRARLSALERSERISLVHLGESVRGREIVGVAIHSPQMVFGQGRRLFVIARQHGNEVSGTEAVLAFAQHFATARGELERGVLEHLTIIAVPMVNPDSADSRRRANARGVDLNRDWVARSQPETAAIERAVRAWQPHAFMDLHELPRSSSKPEYADSFVETIGAARGVPQLLSTHTQAAALDMAEWLRAYRHRTNVYYTQPNRDRRLAHRHYGLNHGIPSFLLEVKPRAGRDLAQRSFFHILGMLVVSNYLVHCGTPWDSAPAPSAPAAVQVAALPEPASHYASTPAPSGGAVSISLRTAPREGGVAAGTTYLEAAVTGTAEVRYVRYLVNGQLWLISNMEPHRGELDTLELGDGLTQVTVEAVGTDGTVLARDVRTFQVDNAAVAGQ